MANIKKKGSKIETALNQPMQKETIVRPMFLEDSMANWQAFVHLVFTKSDALSSLVHLDKELEELVEEVVNNKKDLALAEYADCILCLLSSAFKFGYSVPQLVKAIQDKMQINFERDWILNPDNTYSHKKNKP